MLDDPLPTPFPYAAEDETTKSYHWADFARQNEVHWDLPCAYPLAC